MNLENKYLNLTDEIVCVNSIGENTLQRLSGADFDGDTCLLTDNEMLIRAAQKNYNTFKVSTSLVEAKKIKRYYTAQQLADLDVKTSVNLIGEIVNLSAVLNSLLWSRINAGETYSDVKELYCDICQLNAMSGIEIDSAKKEFDIDNKKELAALRAKYAETLAADDGRATLPHFFAHISRQKGYYNPKRKKYMKYDTTMDYVQTVVNGFRTHTAFGKECFLPFRVLLNPKKYYKHRVNRQQIEEVYAKTEKYCNEVSALYSGFLPKDEARNNYNMITEEFVRDINQLKMGFSTLYAILDEIENEEYKKIRRVLTRVLFLCENNSFNQAIKKSAEAIDELHIDGNGSINLFGIRFSKKTVVIKNKENDTK